jgi:hypothetical protein
MLKCEEVQDKCTKNTFQIGIDQSATRPNSITFKLP